MKRIDMATYPQLDHFHYFCYMAYPYVGVTVDVDVTDLLALCKEKGYSFYLMVLHAVALAALHAADSARGLRGGIESPHHLGQVPGGCIGPHDDAPVRAGASRPGGWAAFCPILC